MEKSFVGVGSRKCYVIKLLIKLIQSAELFSPVCVTFFTNSNPLTYQPWASCRTRPTVFWMETHAYLSKFKAARGVSAACLLVSARTEQNIRQKGSKCRTTCQWKKSDSGIHVLSFFRLRLSTFSARQWRAEDGDARGDCLAVYPLPT